VLDEDPAPPPQKGTEPSNFWPMSIVAKRLHPLGVKVGLGPGDIVLDGEPAPAPQKGGTARQFRPMSIVAKRLDGSRCHLVWSLGTSAQATLCQMGTQLPAKKGGGRAPIFGPCLLWPNGWMDQDATWYEGRPRPGPHCVTWGPSSPPKGGQPPNFRPMSTVTEGWPISATAEHL